MPRLRSLPALIAIVTFFALPGIASAQTQAAAQGISEADLALLKGQNMDSLLRLSLSNVPPQKKQQIEEALAAMKMTEPDIKTVQLKNKTVKFIPMVHAGQKQFYDHVKTIIQEHKKQGYIIFYEQIKGKKPAATTASNQATDTLRLKFRKMIGTEPSRKTYSILKNFFPDITVQPLYDSLGVTKTDVNADVTTSEMVQLYEKLYGPIQLDPCDYKAPPGEGLYQCTPLTHNIDPVIKDFRNHELAKMIKASPKSKILVVYGAAHIAPVMELIRQ